MFALAFGLICGEASMLRSSYKKSEITNVGLQWAAYNRNNPVFVVDSLPYSGFYSFYKDEDDVDDYVRVEGEGDDQHYNAWTSIIVRVQNLPDYVSIVCIGRRDSDGQMIRTPTMPKGKRPESYNHDQGKEDGDNDTVINIVKIVWIVIGIVFVVMCSVCIWFHCCRTKKNQQVRFQGQPQQLQVNQQPMQIYTHPQPMVIQPQQSSARMTDQQNYAMPAAPQM